jgi:hypothetical protein
MQVDFVRDDDHRHPIVCEALYATEHFPDKLWVKCAGRLVEQE